MEVAALFNKKYNDDTIQWSCKMHEFQDNSNSQGGHSNWMSGCSLTDYKPQ